MQYFVSIKMFFVAILFLSLRNYHMNMLTLTRKIRPSTLFQMFPHNHRVLSSSAKIDLSGIYPPIPTPFKNNEDIHWDALTTNLMHWEKIPFRGYVVQGSNGEYVSLSQNEKVDLIEFVRKATSQEKLILAGSGCEGTRETIQLTKEMAAVGADLVLVTTPSFFKNRMNANAMITHYTAVADASPIPVLLYNVPSNTGIELPMDAILELSKHPNIVGLKDSGGNITNIGYVIEKTSHEDFQVLAGSASFLMPALQLGAVGGVCALANVLGQECCDLYTMVSAGNVEDAKPLQLSLIEPNQAVTRKFNVPGLKHALNIAGIYGGPCRKPLTCLTDAEKKEVEDNFVGFL